MNAAGCTRCGMALLVVEPMSVCPVCGHATVELAEARPGEAEPERWVPPAVPRAALAALLRAPAKAVPWFGALHTPEKMAGDAILALWPRWLVDVQAQGHWAAEVGFAEEVEAVREHFAAGKWRTEREREWRDRFEARAGTLSLRVHNVGAPALSHHDFLTAFSEMGEPWDARLAGNATIVLPNFTPEVAWPWAQPGVEASLGELVARATGGRTAASAQWQVRYTQPTWTWLLRPVWTIPVQTDDASALLWVDAVSGKVWGAVPASRRRARRWLVGAGLSAALLAALGLLLGAVGLLFPPLWILALVSFLAAVVPIAVGFWAWVSVGNWETARAALHLVKKRSVS